MITSVKINKSIEDQFYSDVKNGFFHSEVRDLIEYWITEIEYLGYKDYLNSELFKMLNDHELKKERQGQRAITLDSTGGRLIYSVSKNTIIVKVIKITSDHDYS